MDILTDDHASETSWTITDLCDGTTVHSGPAMGSNYDDATQYSLEFAIG